MTIIGSAYVEIRALDTNLRRDIDNAMKKIKDVTINLQADVNLAPVRKKISDLRAELRANPLKMDLEVNDKNLVDKLVEAHQLYKDNPLEVDANTNTSQMEEALRLMQERFRVLGSNLTPHANTARAEAEIAALARRRETTVTANANTARAEAQLDTLARRRTVDIAPKMNMDAELKKGLQGLTYTLLGAVPGPAIKSAIVGVVANLEQLFVSAAKVSTVVGTVSAELLTLGANAFSIIGDLGSVGQAVALLPAIFSGMAISLIGAKIAFGGFVKAFSSNAKTAATAMAKLPASAQEVVKSLKGVWTQIKEPAQNAFWVEMNGALQDTVHTMLPALKDGFVKVDTSLAKMTKGALASFKTLADSGGLGTLFDNVALGLEKASFAVKPFFDAMNKLSVTGSKYLPIFGDFLAKSADKFNNFITKADEAGKINVWIDTAVTNLKSLGSILGSSGSIIKGLVTISDMSGGKGLGQMAAGMENIAKTVNGEPFKSRLVFILEGARAGAEALGTGFGKLMDIVGRSSISLRAFLKTAGEIGGALLTNFSKLFDGTGLGDGFYTFLQGVKSAVENLGPTFTGLGKIMGDMGRIGAVVLTNMVPGLNNLFDTLSKVMAALTDGVTKIIPIFNDFVQNILVIAAPIAIALATAIGNLMSAFADLPAVLRNVILTFGLVILAILKFKKLLADTDKGQMSPFKKRLNDIRDTAKAAFGTVADSFGRVKDSLATTGVAAGYAKDAIKKSFGDIRDSVKLTGMYIADGFKKSLSQVGDFFNSKMKEPLKAFGKMMGAAWKEALMPTEVREGFKVVGQKLMEVARIYTGYFGAAKDALGKLGQAVKTAFPMGMLGPALKALPAEVGKAFAWAGQKVASGVADMAKTLAGPAVGFAMAKMKDVISTQALYASKHLEDIGKGVKNAVAAIQKAPAAVSGALSKLGSAVSTAFTNMQASGAKAFNSAVLAAAIHPLSSPFVTMAAAAKTAAGTATSYVSNMAKSVGAVLNTMTVPARTAFAGIAVAASIQAGIVADKFNNAASRVGGNFATAFKNAARDLANVGSSASSAFSRTIQGVTTAATTTAKAVSDTFQKAAANLKANFAPAGSAISQTFSGLGQQIAPAKTALGELAGSAGRAMGAIGAEAGKGLLGAANGLLGALGGPWGLAIGAATTAISVFAQTQAESKARVEQFTQVLDQQTGAMTGAAKNMAVKGLFDGVTQPFDDFVRDVMQNSMKVTDTLDTLGIDIKKYSDTMADSKGRDALISGMDKVAFALRHGLEVTDDMAAAIGMNKAALDGLNFDEKNRLGDSLAHASEKAKGMADELQRAQKQIEDVARATGTSNVEAAIMTKNWGVLTDTASTASAKFSALKENLDLLNRSSATNANQYKVNLNADKAYAQSLDDTKKAIQAVRDENNGLVNNLFTVSKGFDFTSQAGRDLHTALSGQSDAILQLGTAAMDQALKGGKSTVDAQKAAISAMQPGIDGLKASLKEMGFAQPEIDGIIKSFGLVPENITTALGITGGPETRQQIFLTQLAADAYKSGNYSATLSALPEAAKKAIEDSTGLAGAFAAGNYDAILTALDKTEGGRQAALARILAIVGPGATYEAFIQAANKTGPGLQAAGLSIAGVVDKDYSALIKVDPHVPGYDQVENALNWIARTRSVSMQVQYVGDGSTPAHPGQVVKNGQNGIGANGGLVTNMSNIFGGKFPLAKAFANGGFENHVAQISRGQTPFRVWSEPETGGEAYIPLSKAKRPRSLQILEEVAKMFGFSLVKQLKFANGGILSSVARPSTSPSKVVSSTYSRTASTAGSASTGSTINFTVNPSQGLSEQQIGESAMRELYWQLSSR